MATKKTINTTSDTDDSTGSNGGQSGSVQFRDFLGSSDTLRDDLRTKLPPDVIKRLLSVHQQGNEARIQKQKDLADQRRQLKEGNVSLQNYRENLGAQSMASQYKVHPAFDKSPQFNDRQVANVPADFIAETNDELRNKLQHDYQLKYNPELTLNNRLTSTPKLTRS